MCQPSFSSSKTTDIPSTNNTLKIIGENGLVQLTVQLRDGRHHIKKPKM